MINQGKYNINEFLQAKYDKEFGFGCCAICSIAIAKTEMSGIRYYPDTVYDILKRGNGLINNQVIWESLKKLLGIKAFPHLFDREIQYHYPLDIIKPPAIITVDGILSTEEYDSHFIYVRDIIFNKYDRINYEIFCPINGNLLFSPHFGKLEKKNIFSIINLKRV